MPQQPQHPNILEVSLVIFTLLGLVGVGPYVPDTDEARAESEAQLQIRESSDRLKKTLAELKRRYPELNEEVREPDIPNPHKPTYWPTRNWPNSNPPNPCAATDSGLA